MSGKKKILLGAAGVFVMGILIMIFVNTRGPEPELECTTGSITSGYTTTDSEGNSCPVSVDSLSEWSEWASQPNYGGITGLGLSALALLAAAGVGISSLVSKKKS